MYGAFQSNAYQANAFQSGESQAIVTTTAVPTFRFIYDSQKHREKEYLEKIDSDTTQLKVVDDSLAEAEKRKATLAAIQQEKQTELKKSSRLQKEEVQLVQEISALRRERARLMQLIDDNEAIFLLLLS